MNNVNVKLQNKKLLIQSGTKTMFAAESQRSDTNLLLPVPSSEFHDFQIL